MKIAIARRGYSPTGGAEAYLKRFAAALAGGGHEPVLFGSPQWPVEEWPGGRIVPINARSPRAFADQVEQHPEMAHCERLFSMERLRRCDVYRAGDGVHKAWLERRRRFEPGWKGWVRSLNPKHRQLLEIEARLYSPEGAGRVIANSRLVREEIIRYYGYPAERISVVYNGLPPMPIVDKGERQRVREAYGVAEETFLLLFAGSGWERKGLAFAVEALREAGLPDALLLVAGRGERQISAPQVRYAGPVREMPALYGAADAFILPTLYDPFSNATLEAFCAGLPVMTTAANGFSEVITDGEEGSILREPGDIEALAAAIRWWSDPARRVGLRQKLVERGRAFSMEENLRKTLDILGEAAPA